MNRKEILEKAQADLKKHFWIYVGAFFLMALISSAKSGSLSLIVIVPKLLIGTTKGMLNLDSLLDFSSPFWAYILGSNERNLLNSLFEFTLQIFLIFPLSVGLNLIFLTGTDTKPDFHLFLHPFRRNYFKIVWTMFLSTLFATLTTAAIFLLCVTINGFWVSIFSVFVPSANMISIILQIIFVIFTVLSAIAAALYFTYVFLMIPFVLAAEEGCSFNTAYRISASAIHGEKMKILSVDATILLRILLIWLIPFLFVLCGVVLNSYDSIGYYLMLFGMILIIPATLLGFVFSAYRNAAWANMYKDFVKQPVTDGQKY